MRRRLQLLLLRQLLQLRRQFYLLLESLRQPVEFIRAFVLGPRMRGILFVILGIISLGTFGYMFLFGADFISSLYMTIISITTVGYGEFVPISNGARVFTMILLLSSVTVLAYAFSSSVEYVASGELFRNMMERQQNAMIQGLKNHFIIAGFGRVGQEVALALRNEEMKFIIVDGDMTMIEKARNLGYLFMHGNATEDQVLVEAGIAKAHGIICATGNDATNVYVVLTARGLNEKLFIISRASDESSEAKLIRAGADRVISPYVLSGRRMANLAVRPYVVNFLDVTGTAGELEKTLEEIIVEDGSIIGNRTLGEIDLRNRTGALILGLYRSTGELLTSPSAETLLEPGTRMIVMGTRDELDVTEALSRNFMSLSEE